MSANLCRVCGTEQPASEVTEAASAPFADLAVALDRVVALERAVRERDEKIAALEEELTSPPAEPKADAPASADAKSEAPAAAPAKQKNKG